MKHARHLLILIFLFLVWPVQGQTPTTANDYYNRGIARAKLGDLDGAIADFSKVIEIDSQEAQAYYNRGYARHLKKDLDGAIADYTKYIELEPRDPDGYNNRGNVRRAKGDFDGAIADLNKAIEIDPRYAKAYYNRGFALDAKGDPDRAIADYTKSIELEPLDADGYGKLAWLLATTFRDAIRDGKKAVEYASKAAELTKWEDANTLDTLAAAYAEAGNFDDAIKWENKALSFPGFAKSNGDQARKRLQLYTARKPYHEPPPK
jgi:tetratricopeptide (TPR) repeat protein